MASVPEQLRRAREQQGLTIHQVADLTKMRTDHVRALEEGQYDAFSASVYIRGFVRTYAALLKLPVADLIRELELELGQNKKFKEPPRLGGNAQSPLDRLMLLASRVNWKIAGPVAAVIVLAVAATAATRAWQRHQSQDPTSGLGPGLYQAPASITTEALPLPGTAAASNLPPTILDQPTNRPPTRRR